MVNKETDNRTFMDLFRDEIKQCVSEVVSQMIPTSLTVASADAPLTLTVPQFCKQMNVSKSVAYDLINSEGFPAFRVGTKYLINSQGLQQWINRQSKWEG